MSNRSSVDGRRWVKKETKKNLQNRGESEQKNINKTDEILEKKFAERNDQISMSSALFPMQWLDWFRKCREGDTDFPIPTLNASTSDPRSPSTWQETKIQLSHPLTVNSAILESFPYIALRGPNACSPHRQLVIVLAGIFTIFPSDSTGGKNGTPGTIFLLNDTTGLGHSYTTGAQPNIWVRILLSSTSVSSCSSSSSDSCASDSYNSDACSSSSPSSSSSFTTTSSPTTDPDPTTTST